MIASGNPLVLGLRDIESAKELQKKLRDARRIVVVGNGGIATEIVWVYVWNGWGVGHAARLVGKRGLL